MLLPVSHISAPIASQVDRLVARLIRLHAPRSVATVSFRGHETLAPERAIGLKPVKRPGDVMVVSGIDTITPGEQTQVVIALAFDRKTEAGLRSAGHAIPGFEVKELFHFGFFLLPFLWLRIFPGGQTLLARLLAFELKLHPYLNLMAGIGTVCVMTRQHTEPRKKPAVSVVIPAYNEARRLPAYLPAVLGYFRRRRLKAEVIVVDDGSRDQTAALIRKKFPAVHVVSLFENFGKGAAVREGVMAATGDRVLICDADGATPIEEYAKLEAALDSGSDAAIGSRYLAQSEISKKQSLMRRLVSRTGNLLIRSLLDLPYRDTQCGFKLFERRAAQYAFRNLSNLRFGFDFEVLKKAELLHLRIAEIPVRWADQEGSKVTFRQTIRVLTELLSLRFGHLIKFAFIGVINTIADFTLHNLLILLLGNGDRIRQLWYMVAAFLFANLLAFTLHSGFTFRRRAAYRRFFTVSVFTLAIAALIFHGLNLLYNPHNSIALTNIFKLSTVVISFVTNYFGYKFWVFRYTI